MQSRYSRAGGRWITGSILALLVLAWITIGCSALPQPQAMPTFIPPTAAAPTASALASGSQPVSAVRAANVAQVTRGALAQVVKGRGRTTSARQATLYFPLEGVVNNIAAASGDQVASGAPIMALDTFQLEQDVTNAQFALDKANLDLKQSQARVSASDFKIDVASTVYTRTLGLRDQMWASYQAIAPSGMLDPNVKARFDSFQQADRDFLQATVDLNNAKIEKQSAGLAVETAQLAIQQAQKSLEQARTRLAGAKIKAPFGGLIISIDKNVGDKVQAFEPVGAIADPSQMQVDATVTETDAAGIGVGQAATVVIDGFPNQKFAAKVKEISAKPSIFQGQSVYRITLSFDQPAQVPASLRVGADVVLIQSAKPNVLIVPSTALLTDGSKRYVNAIRDGKAQRVEVVIGIVGESQTEILSGVSENEQIQIP